MAYNVLPLKGALRVVTVRSGMTFVILDGAGNGRHTEGTAAVLSEEVADGRHKWANPQGRS